jgi:hypothetical protein
MAVMSPLFRRGKRGNGDAGSDHPPPVAADPGLEATGMTARRYSSLEEARGDAAAAVILYGDSGGQVYVTAPVAVVRCDEGALSRLLARLDEIAWRDSAPTERSVEFVHAPPGTVVVGGMGGAHVGHRLWVHDGFDRHGLVDTIAALIAGTTDELPAIPSLPFVGRRYVCADRPEWTMSFQADGRAVRADGTIGAWSGADEAMLVRFDDAPLAAKAISDMVLIEPEPGAGVFEAPIQLELDPGEDPRDA